MRKVALGGGERRSKGVLGVFSSDFPSKSPNFPSLAPAALATSFNIFLAGIATKNQPFVSASFWRTPCFRRIFAQKVALLAPEIVKFLRSRLRRSPISFNIFLAEIAAKINHS